MHVRAAARGARRARAGRRRTRANYCSARPRSVRTFSPDADLWITDTTCCLLDLVLVSRLFILKNEMELL